MYYETKEAVYRTIRVCRILLSLEPEEYNRLLEITNAIEFPKRDDIVTKLKEKFKDELIGEEEFMRLVDAEILEDLKIKYSDVAVDAGFHEEHGLAMLEYAAIIRDLDDGYEENG